MSDTLDSLSEQADALGAPAPEGGAPEGLPAPPAESPNFGPIAFLLAGFREVSCALLKVESPRRTLADPQIEQCAKVLAPVADKWGINLADMWNGPEAVALMTAGPILWTAYRELDAELKSRKAKKIEPEAETAAAPNGG